MMDRTRKIRLISNSFYNAGLERAKRRDLTGAVEYLKKCLNLNKYHIDARNLLGLIYYEMGEVSEALVQWVISMNFREQDNRADYYLDQIQRKQDRLDQASATIQKYNQALLQAQTGSDDLATLQLTRVVEANPRFVKAHLLLALLHMRIIRKRANPCIRYSRLIKTIPRRTGIWRLLRNIPARRISSGES